MYRKNLQPTLINRNDNIQNKIYYLYKKNMFTRGSTLYTLGRYGPFIMFIISLIILKAKAITTKLMC